ncbi:peptidase M16, partial [Solemya velum gill symbiont]
MAHNGRKIVSLLLVLLLPLTAQATPEIQSWITAKGAKVMYVHVPDLPMVDVRMVFDAGSARDDSKPGIAALTNTLLNDGAGEWNANHLAERFENIGARFTTSSLRDMAIVSLRTLTDDEEVLNQSLDTIAAVVTQPQFDEEEIERRRQQVLVGLEQQKQNAGTVASKAFYKSLYGDHPYGHNPSGNAVSVAAITVEDIRNYFKQYYVASNLVVAIVGAVDRAQAEKVVEQITAEMPAGEKAAPLPKVTFSTGESLSIDFPSTQTHIYLGQPGMSRSDPDYLPLYVGNHVFGGSGLVSMLSEEVREKRGLSYSVYSYFSPMRAEGPFMMVAQTRNERAEEALGVMREQLADFIKNGP